MKDKGSETEDIMTEKGKPTEYSGDSNHRNLSKREFARKLYKLKNEHGLNQSEVGRRSGISRDMISRYIQGNAMPGPENLAALAKVFVIWSRPTCCQIAWI